VGRWRDVAAAAQQQDVRPLPVVENFGLPDDLAGALRRLETLAPPRQLENAHSWRSVVADAMTIARDQWAANAMALGWTAGDLFGVGPRDDWEFQGLAIWLDGRRLVMLDQARAIAVNAADGRAATFIRGGTRHGSHPTVSPVMLWDFGR